MQFVVLSDVNASDFTMRTTVPIFCDPEAGRPTWSQMEVGAQKHDTFIYARTGERVFVWDASAQPFLAWDDDIRAAVEAQGK